MGRSSNDVSNVLPGISFRTSSMTSGSGADSADGTSSNSKARRKTGAHDERQQRLREATTLQLSELLSGMGRMSQPFSVQFAASSNRSLINVSSQASEPKATDASSEQADANAESTEYHPWWETVDPSTASSSHVHNFHSLRTCNISGLVGLVGLLVDPGAHDNLAGESRNETAGASAQSKSCYEAAGSASQRVRCGKIFPASRSCLECGFSVVQH